MTVLRFALFFAVLAAILILLNRYVLRWAVQAFALERRRATAAAVLLWSSLAVMVASRVADRLWSEAPVRLPLVVASTIQLAVILTAVLLLLGDVALLLRRWLRPRREQALPRPAQSEAVEQLPTQLEYPRRTFLGQAAAGSAFLIGSSSSLYGALAGRHDYVIEELAVRIPGLSRALDGFSIVQLSDIHIGQFVGDAELAAAEDLVRRAKPDLIVLTGDLLDHDARLAERLGRFVRRLSPLAREGVAAISGNHDFYAGIEPFISALERGGARVLQNRGVVLGGAQGIALLGVDDVWARREGGGPDLSAALASLPELEGRISRARDLPRVLLCHNPVYFESSAGRVALQLSGHTHGGQVNPGVRPADWLLRNGWVAGLYERQGSRLYVNRGFGTVGPPVRLGAAPEVTRIVLTA